MLCALSQSAGQKQHDLWRARTRFPTLRRGCQNLLFCDPIGSFVDCFFLSRISALTKIDTYLMMPLIRISLFLSLAFLNVGNKIVMISFFMFRKMNNFEFKKRDAKRARRSDKKKQRKTENQVEQSREENHHR